MAGHGYFDLEIKAIPIGHPAQWYESEDGRKIECDVHIKTPPEDRIRRLDEEYCNGDPPYFICIGDNGHNGDGVYVEIRDKMWLKDDVHVRFGLSMQSLLMLHTALGAIISMRKAAEPQD